MTCSAIVLAAGNSTRMGEQKVLLPFNGVTVIEHIVGRLLEAGISDIVVVGGRDAEAIRDVLGETGVIVVDNPDVERGMLSSVRVGIDALGNVADACLICLGDQPALQVSVIEAVVGKGSLDDSRIVVPEYEGRRGHPLYVPRRYFSNIMSSYDDTGLRGLLQEFSKSICGLAVGESWVLDDMDYPEDYQRELERLKGDG